MNAVWRGGHGLLWQMTTLCVSGQQGHKTWENVNGLMPLAKLLGVFITLLARYCNCCQHMLGSGSSLLGQDRCKWSVDQFTKIRLLRSALTPATGTIQSPGAHFHCGNIRYSLTLYYCFALTGTQQYNVCFSITKLIAQGWLAPSLVGSQ